MTVTEQTNIRLPIGIKERLRREAKRNHRSLNAEISYRLAESLSAQEEPKWKGRDQKP
ncbi:MULTISPECIES: Arc family DNA-binding protein [Halomonadaceae]|uniref:Arc family DNA-binding protein n=1 Tax=Halomonadaceae TaxID=28256 RepID=UPI00159A0F88|nr:MULTISPECIES: Arc family DNA-binding protein [Halomonas]QJQ93899.1 Arc family DNA-binding protein [Halomonas sp. PA5]